MPPAERAEYCGEMMDFRIVDMVKIPESLPLGEYVLSFRWDCEESSQIWTQCADVKITASESPPPSPTPPTQAPTTPAPAPPTTAPAPGCSIRTSIAKTGPPMENVRSIPASCWTLVLQAAVSALRPGRAPMMVSIAKIGPPAESVIRIPITCWNLVVRAAVSALYRLLQGAKRAAR